MTPYYILITAPLIFAFGYELYYERYNILVKKKNYTILIFYAIYFILLAFRSDNIGSDTYSYLMHYAAMPKISLKGIWGTYKDSDIGYYLFTKILSVFLKNTQWLLIIVAAITTIPFAYLYYKETKNSLVTIALLMVLPNFQMNFSGLRQAIAIAFVVPGVYFIQKKRWKMFVLMVILATLFHKSAFIMLVMYPIYHCTIKIKHLMIIVPLGIVVYRFNTQIYLLMASLMGGRFEERYAYVTETGAVTMLIVFMLFTVYAFVLTNSRMMSDDEKGYRNLLLIASFMQMFAPINSIAMRMGYYFIPFIPIIITQATNHLKVKDYRVRWVISIAIYILFTIYYIDKSLSVDSLNIYPYEFFFSK